MANYVRISLLSLPPLHKEFPGVEKLEAAIGEMEDYICRSVDKVLPDKPDLILVPEACDRFDGFSDAENELYYRMRADRICNVLCRIAKENHCYVAYSAIRSVPEDAEFPFRNSTQLIERSGEIVGAYDKNHLVPMELEKRKIAYGQEAPVFQLDFGKVCCAICFDLNFDELLVRYRVQSPDLILFSSFYHGGLRQQQWAYACRAHFAGAIAGEQSRILNPFGETIATTTNYQDYITAEINLDCALVHIDENWEKCMAAKRKYGRLLEIHDPGYVGSVLLSYKGENRSVRDIIKEFDILPLDRYFDRCREHRQAHLVP